MKKLPVTPLIAAGVATAVILIVVLVFVFSRPPVGDLCDNPELPDVSSLEGDSFDQIAEAYGQLAESVPGEELEAALETLSRFYGELSQSEAGDGPMTISVEEAQRATGLLEEFITACQQESR